jgi:tetratricopeptide (TPR) repeat protein
MRAEAIVKKKDADLLARLAFAYARLDNPVDADDYLRRALAIDPENGVALLLSGERKFTRHEFAEAEELYRKAFAHGTEDMFAWLKIAEIHQGDEDTTIEEQALKSAKACFPRYVGPSNAYMQLARFYAKHDRHEDALHELESLCAIDESAFEPRVQLAQGAREAGDRAAQAKWLEQAIEIDPFRRDLHRELGGALRALSRFAEALFELNMALAVDPSMDPKYTPDPAQPLSDEQKALDKSERADIHVEIAELYRLVGDEAKAREAIDDALKLVPDHEQALKLKSAP